MDYGEVQNENACEEKINVTLKCLFTFGEVLEYIFNIPVASSRPNNILDGKYLPFFLFLYQLVAKNVLKIGVIILFPTRHLDSPFTESFNHVFESSKSNWGLEMLALGERLAKNPREKPIGT